jgi:putative acetyltransferase
MALSIAVEDPGGFDVVPLLHQSDSYSGSLYPPESRHQPDVDSLSGANVRFFIARLAGRAVGCGALVIDEAGRAELKRMFVDPAARGHGIGRAMLETIEAVARLAGVWVIQLETGVHNFEALRLYRRFGYASRGPFGGYRDDPLSVFMEKVLA